MPQIYIFWRFLKNRNFILLSWFLVCPPYITDDFDEFDFKSCDFDDFGKNHFLQKMCTSLGGAGRKTEEASLDADSRANWPMLTKFNPAATNKTSQKAKRGPLPPGQTFLGWGWAGGGGSAALLSGSAARLGGIAAGRWCFYIECQKPPNPWIGTMDITWWDPSSFY